MLGNKRRGAKIKHKPLSEKLSQFSKSKKNKNNEDASIESDVEVNEEESSSESKKEENEKGPKKIETQDEIRIRQAKELLKKLDRKGEKEKEENLLESESENEEEEDYLLKRITEEAKKNKKSFFTNPQFNPKETMFIKGHKGTITDLDINKEGNKIITASKDKRSILFDIEKQEKTLLPKFSDRPLTCCSFSSDYKSIYYGSKDKYIYQIDLTSFNLIQKFKAHSDCVTGIAMDTTKEQFYSIGNDNLLKVWSTDTINSVQLETFYGHTSKINCIKTIPEDVNRIITSAMDNFINYWKVDSQSFLQFKINDVNPVDCLGVLNENYFMSGGFNGDLFLWKTNKKKPIYKLNYTHGYQKNIEAKHSFFINTDENDKSLSFPKIEIGNPILSLNCFYNSDLAITGSCKGMLNFYNVNTENEPIEIKLEKELKITNGGCINAIKGNNDGKFIAIGNGTDEKNGRWNTDYETKIGITIVKLFDSE